MPRGSGGKKLAWEMWIGKKSLAQIQTFVCAKTGDTKASVKGWVCDWERGKQEQWKPVIK